jgi:mannan endo-1,4-beta-mannosidase
LRCNRRALLLAAAGAVLTACTTEPTPIGQPTLAPTETHRRPTGPSDPAATDEARKLLAWLTALPQRDALRVVSGQQITSDARQDYGRLFDGMGQKFGRRPAMVGVSFDGYWSQETVPVLVEHWRAGGLVTMDMHRPNPFLPTVDPESYRIASAAAKPDLRALLADAQPSPARDRWRADLQQLGDVMQELSEAGVVVIFRPLHEANGLWFWWGHDQKTQQSASVELYRDIYAYLTGTRKLHNVLWAYSPGRPWDAPRMKYYPGDDVIDIVGPTVYENVLRFGVDGQPGDISDLTSTQRPIGLLETGSAEPYDGSWDAAGIIERIRGQYPQLTMFNCWHGWQGVRMSLVDVSRVDQLMNDPWVISLENIARTR